MSEAKVPSTRAALAARWWLASLVLLAATAEAQDEPKPPATGVTVEKDHEHGKATRIAIDKELSTEIAIKAPPSTACQAAIAVSYEQRNTVATVEGTLENSVCAASHGDYVIVVTVRDASGDLRTLEFNESWQRADDSPITFKGDYEIGPNVDLVRVRPRSVSCTCEEALPQSGP